MINILHLESSKGWGGQEKRILREIVSLPKDKFNTTLVCQPDSEISKKGIEADIPTLHVSMKNSIDLSAIYRIKKIIKENKIDIIHTHSSIDSWVGAIAAKLSSSKPYVIRTRHLGGKIKNGLIYKYLTDLIIVLGESTKEYLIKEKGVSEENITIIPTGIDIKRYDRSRIDIREIKKGLNIKDGDTVVGTVSILRNKKGHIYLLKAACEVIKDHPDCVILIVGDGPQMDNLVRLTNELGITDKVIFTGFREDVINILSIIDIFVFPSTEEAFGTALLEAMALSIPVIASNTGGIPDIVKDKKTGLLVPPADHNSIASAIDLLIDDKKLAHRLGEDGRRFVYERFTTDIMVKQIGELYEEAGKRRSKKV